MQKEIEEKQREIRTQWKDHYEMDESDVDYICGLLSLIQKQEEEIGKMKVGIEAYLSGCDADGPNWNTDILERLIGREPK